MIRSTSSLIFIVIYILRGSELALSVPMVYGELGSRETGQCKDVTPPMSLMKSESDEQGRLSEFHSEQPNLDEAEEKDINPHILGLFSASKRSKNGLINHSYYSKRKEVDAAAENLQSLPSYLGLEKVENIGIGTSNQPNFLDILNPSGKKLEKAVKAAISIWKDLQGQFISLKVNHPEEDPETKMRFLKSLFVLGDHFYRSEFLSMEEINRIEIFKTETVIKLVKFHFELQIFSKKANLLGSSEWLKPEVGLLTRNSSIKHFHRSIMDLEETHQRYLEFNLLKVVIENHELLSPNIDYNHAVDIKFWESFVKEDWKNFLLNPEYKNLKLTQEFTSHIWLIETIAMEHKKSYILLGGKTKEQDFYISISSYIMNFLKSYAFHNIPEEIWPHINSHFENYMNNPLYYWKQLAINIPRLKRMKALFKIKINDGIQIS